MSPWPVYDFHFITFDNPVEESGSSETKECLEKAEISLDQETSSNSNIYLFIFYFFKLTKKVLRLIQQKGCFI